MILLLNLNFVSLRIVSNNVCILPSVPAHFLLNVCFLSPFFFGLFSGLHLQHMEVPRLVVKLEL